MSRKPARKPRGKWTAEVEEKILQAVRMGQSPRRAAVACGLVRQAFDMRVKRSTTFLARVEEADAQCELAMLAGVHNDMRNGVHNKTRLWFMERKWPDLWGRAELRAPVSQVDDDTPADERFL